MTATETVSPALTPREMFVLRQLASGRTVAEIQPLLTQPPRRGSTAAGPGQHAAQSAVERLRVKLGARTHGQMVHVGHVLGLLDADTVSWHDLGDTPEPDLPVEPAAPDTRLCEWCGNELPAGSRIDRRTDSEKCRRALARSEAGK